MRLHSALAYWPALLFLVFAALPFLPSKQAALYAQDFRPLFIYALLALGLNVILGQAGLLHLGIAAFFGAGAYITGILTVSQFPFEQSFVVAAIAATLGAATLGVIATAPTLRLRGDYLALVTMAFGLIAVFVIRNLENIADGNKGLRVIEPPMLPGVADPELWRLYPSWQRRWSEYPYFYFVCLIALALTYLVLGRIERSRLGLAWVALREDELAASCMGLNPAKLKLGAIALGAGIAGLAGCLYGVAQTNTSDPISYDFNRSVLTICCIILGGLGNRPGVILGVLLLIGFDQVLTPILDQWVQNAGVQKGRDYLKISAWRLGIFGLVLILMMRFRPAGLLPESRHQHELQPSKSGEGS